MVSGNSTDQNHLPTWLLAPAGAMDLSMVSSSSLATGMKMAAQIMDVHMTLVTWVMDINTFLECRRTTDPNVAPSSSRDHRHQHGLMQQYRPCKPTWSLGSISGLRH